jgi:hypothetical protein
LWGCSLISGERSGSDAKAVTGIRDKDWTLLFCLCQVDKILFMYQRNQKINYFRQAVNCNHRGV